MRSRLRSAPADRSHAGLPGALLEVGRIVAKPHGLRGDVIVTLTTNRDERVAPGSVLRTGRPGLRVDRSVAAPGRLHRDLRRGRGHRRGRGPPGHRAVRARPGRSRRPVGPRADRGPVEDTAGPTLGTVEAVQANPASDLLVLEGGVLIPLRFVVAPSPGCGSPSTSPTACSTWPERVVPTVHAAALRIDVFTLFPEVIEHYADASILGRARGRGLLDLRTHDLREAATDPHRSVDDAPFGGGAGMVLAPEPVFGGGGGGGGHGPEGCPGPWCCSPRPAGASTSRWPRSSPHCPPGFSLLCGRYEGVDQRVADHLVDEELSVGDFVLAGGELAALVVVEAVVRLRARGARATRSRPPTRASPPVCSSTPSTPGRPCSGAGRCPRCCGPATTAGSSAGAGPRPWPAPSRAAPT